jgi:hypothetical protein
MAQHRLYLRTVPYRMSWLEHAILTYYSKVFNMEGHLDEVLRAIFMRISRADKLFNKGRFLAIAQTEIENVREKDPARASAIQAQVDTFLAGRS